MSRRIEKLLSMMTLEEKVAQLGCVDASQILDNDKFSHQKAEQLLKHGIGQIIKIGGAGGLKPAKAARIHNQIQAYLKDNTRLGVLA